MHRVRRAGLKHSPGNGNQRQHRHADQPEAEPAQRAVIDPQLPKTGDDDSRSAENHEQEDLRGHIDQQARRDDQQSGPDESASGRIGIDSSKPATLFAHGRSDWREQVLLLPGHELGGNPGDVLTACLAELGLAVVVLTAIGATPRCVTHAGYSVPHVHDTRGG